VAVQVVVEPVRLAPRARLARVPPPVRREVGVRAVHAGVEHGDDRAPADARVPCLGHVGVGVGRAARAADRLARVLHRPEVAEVGVVRAQERPSFGIRLGVQHATGVLERPLGLGGRLPGLHLQQLHAGYRQRPRQIGAGLLARVQPLHRRRARLEADDQLSRLTRRGLRRRARHSGERQH
jgi:hypothetical protein